MLALKLVMHMTVIGLVTVAPFTWIPVIIEYIQISL